jgi:hypothetical protein
LFINELNEKPSFERRRTHIHQASRLSQVLIQSGQGRLPMADPDPRSIFDLDDAEAEAAIDAGDFVTHERVAEWLRSWGTENELPCPKPEPR